MPLQLAIGPTGFEGMAEGVSAAIGRGFDRYHDRKMLEKHQAFALSVEQRAAAKELEKEEKNKANQAKSLRSYLTHAGVLTKEQAEPLAMEDLEGIGKAHIFKQQEKENQQQAMLRDQQRQMNEQAMLKNSLDIETSRKQAAGTDALAKLARDMQAGDPGRPTIGTAPPMDVPIPMRPPEGAPPVPGMPAKAKNPFLAALEANPDAVRDPRFNEVMQTILKGSVPKFGSPGVATPVTLPDGSPSGYVDYGGELRPDVVMAAKIKADKPGKSIPEGDRDRLIQLRQVEDKVQGLQAMYDQADKDSGGDYGGWMSGRLRANNPFSQADRDKASLFQVELEDLVTPYFKGVRGDVGTIQPGEKESVMQTFPRVTDSKKVRDAKFARLRDQLAKAQEWRQATLAATGFDTSELDEALRPASKDPEKMMAEKEKAAAAVSGLSPAAAKLKALRQNRNLAAK